MEIQELQKIDFLLKLVNKQQRAKKYKLLFSLDGNYYTGDFVQTCSAKCVSLNDVMSVENDNTIEIPINKSQEFNDLFQKQICFDMTMYKNIVNKSSELSSSDYFRMILEVVNKYSIDFETPLPPFIYNIEPCNETKNNEKNFSPNFMYVPNKNFDVISVVPE